MLQNKNNTKYVIIEEQHVEIISCCSLRAEVVLEALPSVENWVSVSTRGTSGSLVALNDFFYQTLRSPGLTSPSRTQKVNTIKLELCIYYHRNPGYSTIIITIVFTMAIIMLFAHPAMVCDTFCFCSCSTLTTTFSLSNDLNVQLAVHQIPRLLYVFLWMGALLLFMSMWCWTWMILLSSIWTIPKMLE